MPAGAVPPLGELLPAVPPWAPPPVGVGGMAQLAGAWPGPVAVGSVPGCPEAPDPGPVVWLAADGGGGQGIGLPDGGGGAWGVITGADSVADGAGRGALVASTARGEWPASAMAAASDGSVGVDTPASAGGIEWSFPVMLARAAALAVGWWEGAGG